MNDYKKFEKLLEKSGMDSYDMYTKEDLIEFAILVIDRSIKVMKKNDYHGEWLGEKIKEYFGIE